MVGGRQVLLAIAVLSGLAFDRVSAGRLGRRDGSVDPAQSAPGGAGSSTSSEAEVVSVSRPAATVASAPPSAGDSSAGDRPSSSSSSSSAPPGEATTPPSAGPLALTSTGDEFVYPGVFGVGGTLTTDTRAPTRTAEPTKSSVAPSSGSTRGPPPADETPTQSSKLPTPAAAGPDTVDAETGYTYGPVVGTSATTAGSAAASPSTATSPFAATPATTAAAAAATPPRGGPPRSGPPKLSTVTVVQETTESVNLGYGSALPTQTTFVTSTAVANETFTYSPSVSVSYCQPSDLTVAPTSWSVVHTSTITWYGDPEDYTQPYPPISTPEPTSSCIVPVSPPRMTISVCASTGTDSKYKTCEVTTTEQTYGFGLQTSTVPTIVFLTTDKNPAVVYSSIRTPDYGVSQEPRTRDNHASPTAAGGISPPAYNSQNPPQAITESARRPTPTPVTIAVQPTAVVINGNTIRDNPAQQTQVVIIADQTFTIDPTRVVGAGQTIDRPSATGGVFVPVPTSTRLGSLPVVVSSSVAVIGGSSFTLGPAPTVATVSGQTFTIGPSAIAVSSQTLPLPTLPAPTEVVVAGGDLITAIGRSVLVIHGTTLTYATADATTVITVDDDEITLGPGGVTLAHADGGGPDGTGRTTLAPGAASATTTTQYAIVGGATITKVGASVVVIRGVTYTVGPAAATPPGTAAATTITTVVGGETVTVAPDGVTVGSLTMPYPFGLTTVITPGAGAGDASATGAAARPTADGGSKGEEDAAAGLRPWMLGVVWGLGIAVGVGWMAA